MSAQILQRTDLRRMSVPGQTLRIYSASGRRLVRFAPSDRLGQQFACPKSATTGFMHSKKKDRLAAIFPKFNQGNSGRLVRTRLEKGAPLLARSIWRR